MQQSLQKNEEGAGTRRRLLEALKIQGPKTARELAKLLGGGPVAMRVHLRNLHAAGLVAHIEEHQPVGRPVRRFHLTPDADALFAKHYDFCAVKLLESVLAEGGEELLGRLIDRCEREVAQYLEQYLAREKLDRPAALAEHLADLGFMASVEDEGGQVTLVERNCPVSRVSSRYPALCQREATLFARALGQEVTLVSCMARGDAACSFALRGAAHLPAAAGGV
jgi:predicted ArsR family transcriptional regulator